MPQRARAAKTPAPFAAPARRGRVRFTVRLAPLAAFVLLAAALAGCVATTDDPGDPAATDPRTEGEPGVDEPGESPSDAGDDTANDNGGSGPGGDDGGTDPDNASQDPDTDASAKDGPAPPHEQRKDHADDITRPGEYAILERRAGSSDARWDVPTWAKGDWWRWRVSVAGGSTCAAEMSETVKGTARAWDLPVYTIENQNHHCSDGSTYKETTISRTQDDLTRLAKSGYIDHELLFPLLDGKRWVYMNAGETLTHVEVSHRSTYTFNLQTVEAWRITFEYNARCDDNGNCEDVKKQQWYGVANGHLLKEEITVNGAAVPSLVVELIDGSRYDGGLLPGLGPLK